VTEAVLEAGSWIYKMLVTLVLAVICVAIVGLVIQTETNTIDVQRELLFNRILYDPQGFLYTDSATGVTHTGVMNKEYFVQAQDRTNQAFMYLPNYGGAEVTLIDGGTRDTVYINAVTYNAIRVSDSAGIKGGGQLVTRTYPVRIYDNGALRGGWLNVTVAMPAKA